MSCDIIKMSPSSCLIWSYPTDENGQGSWDQTSCTLTQVRMTFRDVMTLSVHFSLSIQSSILERDYVECQCQLVGDYAVAVPPRYGWTIPGPISSGFVVVCNLDTSSISSFLFPPLR